MKFPRINMRDLRGRMRDRLRSKVRIPLIRKNMSLWIVILIPVVFAFASVGGIAFTNRSVFCSTCHEMKIHCETWRMSSHKNIECEQCHIMPGYTNMLKSKINALRLVYMHVKGGVNACDIKGHVPDINCKKCHTDTRDMVVYHGLKITHKKHWNMGVGCTFCHARVVHGENSTTKNTPRMADCFKCHDGKKAPNTCGLCHETLGIRKPSVFSKDWVTGHKQEVAGGQESCKRCHQSDFCDNCHKMSTPHASNWMDVHPAAFQKKQLDCKMCHSDTYCTECHQIKQAHKLGWTNTHQDAFKRQPETCDQCHKRTFCSDCHARYRPHPLDWVTQHPSAANANPTKCKTCHQERFCVDCHNGQVPPSHANATWLRAHGDQVSKSDTNCTECHNANFCLKCHRTEKPTSHKFNWMKAHPIQASMNAKLCANCHTPDTCNKCHGMPMPHPKAYKSTHVRQARSNPKLCQRCHEQQFCKSCHLGSRPATHVTGWVNNHGAAARKSNECTQCHTDIFCNACHTSTMPISHRSGWTKKHGPTAEKSAASCAKCHDSKSCDNCHGGIKMPHSDNWAAEHKDAKGSSLKEGSVCYKCHDNAFCKQCHE